VSLLPGISILALAILLGGLAAVWREHGRRAMPGIRTFATVAAASIALLHLLPEAIADAGWGALGAAAAGLFAPALLERLGPGHEHGTRRTTAATLWMAFAAILVHQIAEGAAVASLARAGALSAAIVLAIAAHTVPLAMVVAIRVLELRRPEEASNWRAAVLALLGVALATVGGGLSGNLLGSERVGQIKPWLLAAVAGLLLHAVSHEMRPHDRPSLRSRIGAAVAGLLGLSLAVIGIDGSDEWVLAVPWPVRIVVLGAMAAAIVVRCCAPRRAHDPHAGAAH
jgi:ZIP family zinc transporter